MRRLLAVLVTTAAMGLIAAAPARADLVESKGRITFLRVHDVGTGFGPPTDFLDVEVVVQIDSQPGKSFGFQLRNDNNRPARQGMLDVLRDAFANNFPVLIDYNVTPPKVNGVMIRVAVVKQ
jgi:hypothetical protein